MQKKRTVILSNEEVGYDIIRSARRSVSLSVKQGGNLVIRAPRFVPEPVIIDFIISKEKWISRQKQRLEDAEKKKVVQTFRQGDPIPFLGTTQTLALQSSRRLSASSDGSVVTVTLPDTEDTILIKAIIDKWYLNEAKRRLIPRVFELSEMHKAAGLRPSVVAVRKMKSRWGTCRTNGKIMLNTELIKKRQELIDSVIIHEMCHLRHHNHGREFYALVEELMPGYKELRKELRYI